MFRDEAKPCGKWLYPRTPSSTSHHISDVTDDPVPKVSALNRIRRLECQLLGIA